MSNEGKTIQFSRSYEGLLEFPPEIEMTLSTVVLSSEQVRAQMGHDASANDLARKELYRKASEPSVFDQIDLRPYREPSRWQRFKWALDRWLPRVHFGPCDHEHCE